MLIDLRKRGRDGEREGDKLHLTEKNRLVASPMCSNTGPNTQPLGLRDNAPINWATWARANLGSTFVYLDLYLNSMHF